MRTVTIIPARGGSKGIPGKNIMPFCGKPLIHWTVRQAVEADIGNVYGTSDDERILEAVERAGAIPIIRPAELANDTATSESALRHAIDNLLTPDTVVFLQATSPLRTSQDIREALSAFKDGGYDSLFSACEMSDTCIWEGLDTPRSVNFDWRNRVRRQERERSYLENGSIFIFKPWVLARYKNRMGGKIGMYMMPFWKSFEIDEPDDVEIVEHFFKTKILGGK